MRKFGLAVLALISLGLAGVGLQSIREAIAQGESIVGAMVALTLPLLVVGAVVGLALQRVIRPLRRHTTVTGLIALLVAAGGGVGIYAANSDIPLQRPDATVVAAVAPACLGQAVPAAGRVHTDGSALNHIVMLDTIGAESGWTGKPPVDWRPSTIDEVELVVCADPDDTLAVVEVCQYNGPSTTRYAATRAVRVVAASTGIDLARFAITSQPDQCPGVKTDDLPEIKASVDWFQVAEHLESLVRTGAFVDPDPRETSAPRESDDPGSTTEPGVGVREVALADAIARDLVTAKGAGESLSSLDIEIISQASEPLIVVIPAGTYVIPKRAATQTMVVITSTWVEVPAGEVVDATVEVACAQMYRDQPGTAGKADTFSIRPKLATGDLRKLLASVAFTEADFRIQQFAVWTITDNPAKPGYVHLGFGGFGTGPSSAELREIKSIFKSAGITTNTYRALP